MTTTASGRFRWSWPGVLRFAEVHGLALLAVPAAFAARSGLPVPDGRQGPVLTRGVRR